MAQIKTKSKISVIIPLYNAEKYLATCLENVVHQTHKDLEILIVDDGSQDCSSEIYTQYAQRDQRIKIIRQVNAGVSCARNAGLQAATGDYIHFMDSDDYLSGLDYYEKMLAGLIDADADIACSGIYIESNPWNSVKIKDKVILAGIDDKIKLIASNQWQSVRFLYKKSVIYANSLRFAEGISLGEDLLFVCLVMCHAGAIVLVPGPVYWYRNAPSSCGKRNALDFARQRRDSWCYVMSKIGQLAQKYGFELLIGREYSTVVRYRFIGIIWLKKKIYNNRTRYYLFNKLPILTRDYQLIIES
jgi:CDP-glycerol glycerophosphotransferase